ncbi:MAG: hypothetical protein KBD37_05155 [Burkholderiales bacterium]|nr:hypothetical protein [Burkholderiales bacterium]
MQVRPFSVRHFLLKVGLFIAIFYAFVITTSILITAYLFISLDSYKTRIEGVIYRHTGYKLTVGDIHTSLSRSLLPEITISNATLINPADTKQNFSVKQLQFVFSYSSIWNLEPIFDQINIDETNINFEYLKDGSIVFNGVNINHPDKKTLENTKNSPIDLELWILKQKQIKLTHINLSFWDKKNNLPKLELYNVTSILQDGYKNKHNFFFTIGKSRESQEQMLGAKLNWVGGRVTEFYDWQSAELKVQSYNENDSLATTVKQYLPGVTIADTFNADTAIDAQIKDGKLQFFYANFDIKNLRYALIHHQNLINFPQLEGSIKIQLVNDDHYTLEANNFNISTPKGYIFNNESIAGNYIIGKKGIVTITDTDIEAFNNLLTMFPTTNKFSVSGTLELIKLSWLGRITHPSNINIMINFKDFALISKDVNIPSIDHVNGSVSLSKESGAANITLHKSILNYPKIFLIPYKFNSLSTQIKWRFSKNTKLVQLVPPNPLIESGFIESSIKTAGSKSLLPLKTTVLKAQTAESGFMKDKILEVTLSNTRLDLADFKGTVSGKYTYVPGTHGFLDLRAHVDRVLTSKVGDYLPREISMPVHKWLNDALIGGYGANANLILKGWLNGFPYERGNGIFYIDADIDRARLRYIKNWPTLDDISGKFQIRNQKIIITTSHALILNNTIHQAQVEIPDMTAAHEVYLTADGIASGTTDNFMTYLSQTPINEIIGKLPEKVTTKGNGNIKIHLMVPFANPEHTKVEGDYQFINNKIKFDLAIPELSNVFGILHFSEKGIKIEHMATSLLNSVESIRATTTNNGNIQFNITAPALDFKSATEFYAPFLEPIVSGNAATNISFEIAKKSISPILIKSDLVGININAPIPLKKESAIISNLNIMIDPHNFMVNINYANTLWGKIKLNEHGKLEHANLAIGNKDFVLFTPSLAKIIIRLNTPYIYSEAWLDTVTKMIKGVDNKHAAEAKENGIPAINLESGNKITKAQNSQTEIFPIEVICSTSHLMVYTTDYFYADGDILALKDMTLFNINNTLTNGFGSYTYTNKNLNVFLNDFNVLKAVDTVLDAKNKKKALAATKSGAEFAQLNQESAIINIKNNVNAQFDESAYTLTLNKQSLKQFVESATTSAMNFPSINLLVNNLYFENIRLAQARVKLKPLGNDLIIESGEVLSKTTHTIFHGTNYCMECGANKAFVELNTHLDINDLGKMLDNLGYNKVVAKGSGTVDATFQWNGKIQDFNLAHSIGSFKIDLKNGKFLKVSTGSIFGEIIGLLNLQTITNFAHLDFSQAFSNGFYFNTLKVRAYLLNNVLTIKSAYMTGPLATVLSYGTIDINNEMVDSYISIVPKLGVAIALGAGATLTPIVGLAVYAGELILGDPLNKLFTFAYHVTGSLKKPTITKVEVSQQLWHNLNSALGLSGITSNGK